MTIAGPTEGASPVRFHPSPPRREPAPSMARTCARTTPLALYLHVPFCVTRCFFCDFVTVVGKHVTPEAIQRYMGALRAELAFVRGHPDFDRHDLATAQLGGGTPTMLEPAMLAELIAAARGFMTETGDEAEVVVEGFPTSVRADTVAVLADVPGLKFNMGVQSFDDDVLAAIGRRHEGDDALRSLATARAAGLPAVGVDLIYGLPGSDVDTAVRDVTRAVAEGVDHVALYPLWVYPQTRLNSLIACGRTAAADLAERRAQLRVADAALVASGFERYTAFHYARGPEQRHGYGLWQMRGRDWLGLGQGAVSQLDGVIYENDRGFSGYLARAAATGEATVSAVRQSRDAQMSRHLSYGLRLSRYRDEDFATAFGQPLEDALGAALRWMVDEGLVTRADGHTALTSEGILRLGEIEEHLSARTTPPDRDRRDLIPLEAVAG